VRDEYDEHMVSGLNKIQFRHVITRLLTQLNAKNAAADGSANGKTLAVPKDRDLLKVRERERERERERGGG